MEKSIQISILLDFYKELLTKKQADVLNLYYNQDLSLSEISEHLGITRQAVRDSIKRGEKALFELEDRLGLAWRFRQIQNKLHIIEQCIKEIQEINEKTIFSAKLEEKINIVNNTIKEIVEKV